MALTALVALALAAAPPQVERTPDSTASAFLVAFKAMDEPRFDEFFAADVTMYFPDGPFPQQRVEGKQAVLAAFHKFFALVKERGRTGLNIEPLAMKVQRYGEVAIVTFGLDNSEAVGRRSIILRRIGADWQIAHFHASSIDK